MCGIVVKFKTFRIKFKNVFKKVQEKIKFVKVRKSSKAALMSVSQSSSLSEESILALLRSISSMMSIRRRLQCPLTMYLTVAQACSLLRFFVCIKLKVDQFNF